MSNIIQFARKRHAPTLPINLEAAARVAEYVHLRPGPAETATQFVTRIVRAYKGEGGE